MYIMYVCVSLTSCVVLRDNASRICIAVYNNYYYIIILFCYCSFVIIINLIIIIIRLSIYYFV